MNAITLYLSTCKLVMKIDQNDPNTWKDLYRLVPYLRQSLSCTVCGNLALEPHTPTRGNCQHHVCLGCKSGRKKLKPTCQCCRVYTEYRENWQLRSIQKCYKQLCIYFKTTQVYKFIFDLALNSHDSAATNLMELICEASLFPDNYKSSTGLTQTDYSILPYVFVHNPTTTATAPSPQTTSPMLSTTTTPPTNGQPQITSQTTPTWFSSKKVTSEVTPVVTQPSYFINELTSFKKPSNQKNSARANSQVRRKGCRCGNATPTPGKLTCCGQRCPCYVDSKACLECRCRGCRNPHRADGIKVRPHIPATQNLHIHYPEAPKLQVDLTPELNPLSLNAISFSNQNLKVVGLYSGDFPNQISSTVPSAILVGDDTSDLLNDQNDLELDI